MITFTLVYAAAAIGIPLFTLAFCIVGQRLKAA
jgi:hypothetical protein